MRAEVTFFSSNKDFIIIIIIIITDSSWSGDIASKSKQEVDLSICLSDCPPVCLPACLFIRPCACLHVCWLPGFLSISSLHPSPPSFPSPPKTNYFRHLRKRRVLEERGGRAMKTVKFGNQHSITDMLASRLARNRGSRPCPTSTLVPAIPNLPGQGSS